MGAGKGTQLSQRRAHALSGAGAGDASPHASDTGAWVPACCVMLNTCTRLMATQVRKSMARIKLVLSERANAVPDIEKRQELKDMINAD